MSAIQIYDPALCCNTGVCDVEVDQRVVAHPRSPLLRQRARNELREITAVATRHATRYAVVPLLAEEPVGVERLSELAGRVTGAA